MKQDVKVCPSGIIELGGSGVVQLRCQLPDGHGGDHRRDCGKTVVIWNSKKKIVEEKGVTTDEADK
jgi:hypothetical protein